MELNELIYSVAKLVCEKIGAPRGNSTENADKKICDNKQKS